MFDVRIFVVASGLSLSALLVPPGAQAQTGPSPRDPRTGELVRQINAIRVAAGRLPLADAPELDAAAQGHSEDMVANAYLDHTGSDGTEPQDRAVRAGYDVPPRSGWLVVEVISAISANPSGPVNWWINGDPAVHGKVLLNPRWREIGGGYAHGGPYGNYWTVLVGCRPGVIPTVLFDGVSYEHAETCA
ncbi:MAG TPA: CAP domain-containing protein [Chloroflexota bacterium]